MDKDRLSLTNKLAIGAMQAISPENANNLIIMVDVISRRNFLKASIVTAGAALLESCGRRGINLPPATIEVRPIGTSTAKTEVPATKEGLPFMPLLDEGQIEEFYSATGVDKSEIKDIVGFSLPNNGRAVFYERKDGGYSNELLVNGSYQPLFGTDEDGIVFLSLLASAATPTAAGSIAQPETVFVFQTLDKRVVVTYIDPINHEQNHYLLPQIEGFMNKVNAAPNPIDYPSTKPIEDKLEEGSYYYYNPKDKTIYILEPSKNKDINVNSGQFNPSFRYKDNVWQAREDVVTPSATYEGWVIYEASTEDLAPEPGIGYRLQPTETRKEIVGLNFWGLPQSYTQRVRRVEIETERQSTIVNFITLRFFYDYGGQAVYKDLQVCMSNQDYINRAVGLEIGSGASLNFAGLASGIPLSNDNIAKIVADRGYSEIEVNIFLKNLDPISKVIYDFKDPNVHFINACYTVFADSITKTSSN